MAKKKQSAPPQAQPLDYNQILGQSATGIGKVSSAASKANIQGVKLGMSELADYLSSDGRSLTIDPAEKKRLVDAISSSNKKLPKAKKTRDDLQTKFDKATKALEDAEAKGDIKNANSLRKTLGKLTPKLEAAKTAVSTFETTIADSKTGLLTTGPSITELYQKADPKTYDNIAKAGEYAAKIGQISPEGQRFLDAAGAGYQARDIGTNAISAAQIGRVADINSRDISAAQIAAVDNIRARQLAAAQTGVSGLGQNLMTTAQERLALGGNLSAQASRDAIQAARAGMAARGLGTGNSALAAELLNRDRYSQQRFLENAGFAQGVEQTDLQRRLANTQQTNAIAQANQDAALRASMANQAAAQARAQEQARLQQQANLANQQAALEAATRNQNTALALGQANAGFAQQASLANQEDARLTKSFNEQNRLTANQQNLQQLGAASNYVDATNRAGMAAATDMANINSTYNPLFRNLGMSQQNFFGTNNLGSAAMGPSIDLAGNVASFNANMQGSMYNTYQNNQTVLKAAKITGGATNNAGWMAMLGGMAQGAGALGGGYLAGQSDRREKTDIKKIGKDPLGLNTYEYKYKGDDRKRTGVMAQEVRKVLPEAVEEVEIKGKKRLAIRPTVLGQAYAQAIAADQKIMFPDGYVVGSGKA